MVLVEVLELWARELRDRVGKDVGDRLECNTKGRLKTLELVDTASLSGLESEACEVVALEEVGTVEDTASDIAKVDTSEGVGSSGVATDLNSVWVGSGSSKKIGEHIGDAVGVGSVAAVPVERNACINVSMLHK